MLESTGSHGRGVEQRVPEMRHMEEEFNCTSTRLVCAECDHTGTSTRLVCAECDDTGTSTRLVCAECDHTGTSTRLVCAECDHTGAQYSAADCKVLALVTQVELASFINIFNKLLKWSKLLLRGQQQGTVYVTYSDIGDLR